MGTCVRLSPSIALTRGHSRSLQPLVVLGTIDRFPANHDHEGGRLFFARLTVEDDTSAGVSVFDGHAYSKLR